MESSLWPQTNRGIFGRIFIPEGALACMIRLKAFAGEELAIHEIAADGEDKLVLIDDAKFVSAFAEAGQRLGQQPVCVRCFDPARALRALVLLLEGQDSAGECSGSVGLCCDCYRDLAELLFHDAVLRASRSA